MDATNNTPCAPLLAVDLPTAAKMIGMSRSHFYECDKTGEVGPVSMKCGGKRLYSVVELTAWVSHGMPARGRWLEMWPALRGGAQESPGMARSGPGSGRNKRQSVTCGGQS